MAKPNDLRLYFNSNGVSRIYPVSSLEEATYLHDKLAEGDLSAGDDIQFNVIELEKFDGDSLDWESFYDEDGRSFSEIQEEEFDGKEIQLTIKYL